MKGTLLLLALLVTGELGFQTMEACIPYFKVYTAMVLGDKKKMNDLITKFHPTDKEREAMEKIQECFNERGFKAKALDGDVLHKITVRSPCAEYYTNDTIHIIVNLISILNSLEK